MGWSIRRVVGVVIVALAVLGVHGDAQQPASVGPADQPPRDTPAPSSDAAAQDSEPSVFRAGINFVRVDVIVSGRDGQPLEDLTQDDFQVFEDGAPQAIASFKLVTLDGGVAPDPALNGPPREIRSEFDEEAEASRDDVRVFAVFLDDYHVRRETAVRVRAQLAEFVTTRLGPSDMVGLMYPLQPIGTVRLTRNRDAVVRALQEFVGRKYDYEPTNDFEQRYVSYPTETVERIRNDVSLSALEALIVHLGGLKEGRKALLVVSEGFTNMVPPQRRSETALLPVSPLSPNADPLAGQNDMNEARASWFAESQMRDQLRFVWDAANKNNVALYTVDPRGLASSEFDIADNIGPRLGREYLQLTQDTLRVLAEETDGRAIVNRNDVTPGLEQIVRDSSAYYLIGYDSSTAPTDGKFHKIDVKVKRPNVQVRARAGYWAITRENAERILAPQKPGAPPAVARALAAANEPVRARLVQSWLGTSRGAAGQTTITYAWQPTPPSGRSAADRAAAVSVMVLGDDGTPYYRGRVAAPQPAGGAGPASGPARVSFDVPPGLVHVRFTIEDANQDTLDSEVRDLEVPDLTSPDVVIGTPRLYRARTARQLAEIKEDADPMPVIGSSFSRAERLLVRVPVYGVPRLSARLLNQLGDAMQDLAVERPASPDAPAQIELSLASLAPGEYVLEIAAEADPDPVVEYVGIRVGN